MKKTAIPETLEELKVPVSGLVPYSKNPRRGNVDVIVDSLKHHGQYRPIVVRARTNEVLAGNHTLQAAKVLGWQEIAATFIDCSDDEAARIVLVDNRANDVSTYDDAELIELLDSIGTLEGTGFDEEALANLAEGLDPGEPEETPEDIDDAGEVPTAPISKAGDIWEVGQHRVVCGDSTDPATFELLMGDKKADVIWTDPPYGVDYRGGRYVERNEIANDGAATFEPLITAAFAHMRDAAKVGAPVYIAHADANRVIFETVARSAGFLIRQNLVWVKGHWALSHTDYQWKHEPIMYCEAHEPLMYGFTPGGKGRLGRGGPKWYGPNNATTVFEFPKPAANRDHPTMKPVDLIRAMLTNSLRPGGIVLDPFGGSGSTLLATHLEGGIARLIELDPRYVDVICRRYQELTGELPTLDGEPHDFIADKEPENGGYGEDS